MIHPFVSRRSLSAGGGRHLGCRAVQNRLDLLGHFGHRRHSVDAPDDALRFVIRKDRRGLGAIFLEPVADRLGIVVRAPLEAGRAADVADTADLRALEEIVIALAAARAGEAAGDPVDQRILVDGDLDDMVELHAPAVEQPLERRGLGSGAGKTVEDEAALHVRLLESVGEDADDDLVRNEIPGIHYGLGLESDLGLGGDRCAKHISGRELHHPPIGFEPARLGPLSCPRRPKQYDVHRALPPFNLALLIRSPYWWAIRWLWICVTVSIVTLTTISKLVPPR